MKKIALLTLLSLSIVGVAGAQSKPAKAPTKIKCAVMTNEDLVIATATKNKMFADYKGRRYYFCCAGCPAAFKANPAKYAKSPSLPTPKK